MRKHTNFQPTTGSPNFFFLPHDTSSSFFFVQVITPAASVTGPSRQLPAHTTHPALPRALCLLEMPNVRSVGKEFYGDYGSCCQKLRMIILISMDCLEEWWTTRSSIEDGEFLIPNLHLLVALDCPKLKFPPYPPRSMTWATQNSDHVLPEHGFGNLSSITNPFCLEFRGAPPSCEMWRRAQQHLSSVEILCFTNMASFVTLPEATRSLPSLRTLDIG
jgi:aquaporin TIP